MAKRKDKNKSPVWFLYDENGLVAIRDTKFAIETEWTNHLKRRQNMFPLFATDEDFYISSTSMTAVDLDEIEWGYGDNERIIYEVDNSNAMWDDDGRLRW